MSESRGGTVITFYSYKGGTGRTMALANVAWILAANGHRVLAADWDLEAPGLQRFFAPFLDTRAMAGAEGIVGLIRDYQLEAVKPAERAPDWYLHFARASRYAVSLKWSFPQGGSLDFLPAGQQNQDYVPSVTSLDWDNFYSRLGGSKFFDALRQDMKSEYDYVLIDSRTGISDVADICTVHLPDVLVACFTLNGQSIDGAADVAQSINWKYPDKVRVFPVPMRVDESEKEKADLRRQIARRRFDRMPDHIDEAARAAYWSAVEIPYRPFYAYEEVLAVFGDRPGVRLSLLSAFEQLTAQLTDGRVTSLPEMPDEERRRMLAEFSQQVEPRRQVTVAYVPENAMWGDWITAVLRQGGFEVTPLNAANGPAQPSAGKTLVTVVSSDYVESPGAMEFARNARALSELPGDVSLISLFVGDVRTDEPFANTPSATLRALPEAEAANEVLRVMGHAQRWPKDSPLRLQTRFPAQSPRIWNVPGRNANFTGRDDDIERLRQTLTTSGTSVLLPVALHGLGGVGKTQVAVEYAYRFRADYDIVWWINAQQPTFIDTALLRLGDRLGLRQESQQSDYFQKVVRALESGTPHGRWLLIFDNAVKPTDLQQFLPRGAGHVLITSRERAWNEVATALDVDVFDRQESISHLRQRVRGMDQADADRVASALGDLPLAVAGAGAWLAETGTPVNAYLDLLRQQPSKVLEETGPEDYPEPVERVWSLALERLQERSPAAARLFQLCSVFDSEIAKSLVASNEMAAVLSDLEPTLAEPLYRHGLTRELSRLALIKNDEGRQSIHVHRLLQAVVRDRLTLEELDSVRRDAHRVLAAARPTDEGAADEPGQWPQYEQIWPHLEPTDLIHSAEPKAWEVLADRVRFLWQRGDLANGRTFAEDVDRIWEERLAHADEADGDTRPLRLLQLRLRYNLANILRSEGSFRAARRLDEAIFEERLELNGEHDPHTLMAASVLAADLRAFGEYDRAHKMDLRTYASFEDQLDPSHPRVLAMANNIAVGHRLLGHYSTALDLDRRTLAARRTSVGERHRWTLYSEAQLGRDLREIGDYQQSIARLEAAREAFGEVVGELAPDTLNATMNLAVSLLAAGRTAEARTLIEKSLKGYQNLYHSESNPYFVICKVNYATVLYAAGHAGRARETLREALAVIEAEIGANQPYPLACVNNLAVYLREEGESAQAHENAERAFRGLEETLGAEHPHSRAAAMTLANCLADQGRHEQAATLNRATLAILRTLLGHDHPDTLRCQVNFGLTLAALGAREESAALVDEGVRKFAEHVGEDHPGVAALRQGRFADRLLEPREI
ncbi:MAG TPA: FxSxx-COOH system tetratricopeptide repeat protein [Actinocrinis sp.]|nr:FxSxx-COOH system tetratricopeptide repeat protein [Actinocrinis sp.]